MQVLLLDNLDSFTYNIRQGFAKAGADVVVLRRDEVPLDDLERKVPDLLGLGPGPDHPEDADPALAAISAFAERVAILSHCQGTLVTAREFFAGTGFEAGPGHGLAKNRVHI